MSYINNSLNRYNINNNNQSKFLSFRRYVQVPQNTPKYSLYKEIEDQENFRRNVESSIYKSSTKKSFPFGKFLIVLTAISSFFIFKTKGLK